jgi:hypothetical protein
MSSRYLRPKLRISIIVFSILCFPPYVAPAQNKKPPLTNIDIINMTKAGVDDSIIIRAIQTSETNFDVSPNGLIQLKKAKVKKKIIEIMQQVATNRDSAEMQLPASQIRTQHADHFTIDLKKCEIAPDRLPTCYFTVTNNGQESGFNIRTNQAVLIDDLGKANVGIFAQVDKSGAGSRISPGISVPASISFDMVSDTATKVVRLKIRLHITEPWIQPWIEFRNIPLEAASTKK